jgi:hypothetical protein
MTDNNKDSEKAKSFTTRVSGETWSKINEYKKYGKWNTNQFTNHALDAFFEIIEAEEANPRLPLVCETIRDMRRKSRNHLVSESSQEPVQAPPAEPEPVQAPPAEPEPQQSTGQQMKERMTNVDKPWLDHLQTDNT